MTAAQVSEIREHIQRYAGASAGRAAWTLLQTLLAQGLVLYLYYLGYLIPALLLNAGIMVRAFIIYHDGIHGAYLKGRAANERLAKWLQLWVVTPFGMWQKNHLEHHGNFGNLDFADKADTIFFTRQQFEAYPRMRRVMLRILREPVVFFLFAPFLQWWVQYPLQFGNPLLWMGHALHLLVAWQLTWWHLLSVYAATILGLALFHLQHGVSRGYRAPKGEWDFFQGALLGSTWVNIPWPLSWFTLGIEFHHIHHANPRVPCYRIAACHREAPEGMWSEINSPGLLECAKSFRNVMWDEEKGELRSF